MICTRIHFYKDVYLNTWKTSSCVLFNIILQFVPLPRSNTITLVFLILTVNPHVRQYWSRSFNIGCKDSDECANKCKQCIVWQVYVRNSPVHQWAFLGCHETFQVFFTYKPAKLSTGLNQEHNQMWSDKQSFIHHHRVSEIDNCVGY